MTAVLLIVLLASGDPQVPSQRPVDSQGFSLLGQPLFPPPLPRDVRLDRELKRKQAYENWEAHPEDVMAWIWLGRRTAYLGLYQDAIDLYTRGIERFPDDARLYRHRGHRFITVRQFDLAIADLERAAKLIEGTADTVEPDGLPNARNQPTSTLHGNVWYHLGLAYYLEGKFEQALRCYRECLEVSTNPDMLCATSNWMYMTLRRLGKTAEAEALLEPIDPSMEIIENHAYHRLLLLYRGEETAEQLLASAAAEDSSLDRVTIGYGVGNFYYYNDAPERGLEIFGGLLADRQWAGFGYIAAEAEIAREKQTPEPDSAP